jgi:hypothetical protein
MGQSRTLRFCHQLCCCGVRRTRRIGRTRLRRECMKISEKKLNEYARFFLEIPYLRLDRDMI